ncbi:Lysine exporter protein (LYSE/YGGA) [alpha proteobacterium BAL199]|nr:Lysine exporter protein (LYSE/YGGA) [alpha proteobacterium BAL199]
MTLESLLAFAAAMVVFGLTPGPAVLGIVARCLAGGFRAGISFNLGVVTGDLIFLAFAVYGLSAIAAAMGEVFVVVKWLGAGYLVWLGIQLWRSAPVPLDADPAAQPVAARDTRSGLLAGLLLALGNPKGILFYGAFLPTFMDIRAVTHTDMAWLSVVTVVTLSAVNYGYGLLAARARRWFRSRRALTALNRGSGTVMIGAGLMVAAR